MFSDLEAIGMAFLGGNLPFSSPHRDRRGLTKERIVCCQSVL